MSTETDQLRLALRRAAERDCKAETCAIVEQMLERGMLQYHSHDGRGGYWSVSSDTCMLDQIYGLEPELDSILLELFVEGKLALCTNRLPNGPGIYWFCHPRNSIIV